MAKYSFQETVSSTPVRLADKPDELNGSPRSGGGKTRDDSTRPLLGSVDDAGNNLGVVRNYPGAMVVLVDAMKKKGVRFDELDFEYGDITYENNNVVVLRGAAYEIIYRAFKCEPCCIT